MAWYGVDRINTMRQIYRACEGNPPDHYGSSSSNIKADLLQSNFTIKDVLVAVGKNAFATAEINMTFLPWIWGLGSASLYTKSPPNWNPLDRSLGTKT